MKLRLSQEANDEILSEKVDGLDLVLGGHDHHYAGITMLSRLNVSSVGFKKIGDTILGKSGTDFREFSVLSVTTFDLSPYVYQIFPGQSDENDDPSSSLELSESM